MKRDQGKAAHKQERARPELFSQFQWARSPMDLRRLVRQPVTTDDAVLGGELLLATTKQLST